jgi:hypothetical protein
MLDEADVWISNQERIPTKDGQFGWGTLQKENTVEGETGSGLKTRKSVVKKLKLLAARPEKRDSESKTNRDQMSSVIPPVDWALRPSGAGRYEID